MQAVDRLVLGQRASRRRCGYTVELQESGEREGLQTLRGYRRGELGDVQNCEPTLNAVGIIAIIGMDLREIGALLQ